MSNTRIPSKHEWIISGAMASIFTITFLIFIMVGKL